MLRITGMVVALALAIAAPAAAQQAPTAAPDPVRLELARQVVNLSGGTDTAKKMLDSMYGAMDEAFAKVVPADKMPLFRTMQRDIRDETLKMIPDLMAQSVDIYARVMTEPELRAMLAFYSSETGQGIINKTPVVMNEIMRAQIPYLQKMMPRLMQKVVDNACAEAKCSPAERQEVANIMAKALGGSAS